MTHPWTVAAHAAAHVLGAGGDADSAAIARILANAPDATHEIQTHLITFLDEFSAMVDKKTLMRMYEIATENNYNFLYINLLAGYADHMFYWNLDTRLIVSRNTTVLSRNISPCCNR